MTPESVQQQIDRGRAEAERLRPIRQQIYAIKRAHDWQCENCKRDESILVVRDGERLVPRCEHHRDGLTPVEGQSL